MLGRLGGLLMGLTSGVAKAAAIGYVGVCALAFAFQRKLQYFPTTEHPPAVATLPPAYGDIEEFTVRTEDGVTIRGYHLPVPTMNIAHTKHPKITSSSSTATPARGTTASRGRTTRGFDWDAR